MIFPIYYLTLLCFQEPEKSNNNSATTTNTKKDDEEEEEEEEEESSEPSFKRPFTTSYSSSATATNDRYNLFNNYRY